MTREIILQHLRDVEKEYNVKVLYAAEAGSRAWGFASNDSDWDVRFIYVHRLEWYLRIEEQRDVIERMYPGDVDLAGWDLKKALVLFKRSNPSLAEWLHSPIVYFEDKDFINQLKALEISYFNPLKTMYHYQRIYIKHDERYLLDEGFPLKPFMYYLRGVLACRWVDLNRTLPPVAFSELVEATVPEGDIKERVAKLVELKSSGKENYKQTVDAKLFNYARDLAARYKAEIGQLNIEPAYPQPNDTLNSLCYNTITRYE